jgi:hypothetical protein
MGFFDQLDGPGGDAGDGVPDASRSAVVGVPTATRLVLVQMPEIAVVVSRFVVDVVTTGVWARVRRSGSPAAV